MSEKSTAQENTASQEKVFGKYHELTLLAIGFFLTTVMGGFLGTCFQENSWRHRQDVELLESEKKAATMIFEEVSRLMDKRLYRARRILWGYQDGEDQKEMEMRWAAYREILFTWNENLNRILALLQRYFGEGVRSKFEKEIHVQFRTINLQMEDLQPGRKNEGGSIGPTWSGADKLNGDLYALDVAMIEMIQKEQVGAFIK